MPVTVNSVVFFLIGFSMVFYLRRDAFKLTSSSWDTVSIEKEGLTVTLRHQMFSGKLAKSTFVSPYLIILCVVPDGLRWPVCWVIIPDAIEQALYRRLCIYLRHC